jgi:hypothetical protein
MMEINRKQIVATLLRILSHISDLEYQQRVWLRGEGPEVDDFDETVDFFFDLGDPILKDYKDYGISKEQYQLLKEFRGIFEAFADTHFHPLEFITSSEWETIRDRAKEVLKAFNYTRLA